MRSLQRALALTLAAAFFGAAPAASQQSVALEFRAGFPRPMGDFRDPPGIEAQGDVDFGGDLILNVSKNLSLYGGWGRDGFTCSDCSDSDYIHSQGFEGGAKFLFVRDAGILPWVRLGILAHQAKVKRGSFTSTSDRALGFQGGAGVDVPLGEVLSFSPALRYQKYTAEFPVLGDNLIRQEHISYLALDFGIHIHLGS